MTYKYLACIIFPQNDSENSSFRLEFINIMIILNPYLND